MPLMTNDTALESIMNNTNALNVWYDWAGNYMDAAADIMKFWKVAIPGKPSWFSKNKIIHETDASLILEFNDDTGRIRTDDDGPVTVIIPAQAGTGGTHADHDDGKSIVQSIMSARQGRVIVLDHKPATYTRRNEDLSFLVAEQRRVFNMVSDKPVHVVSLCSSGYISTMCAALPDHNMLTLTPVASPQDFHRGDGYIHNKLKECGSMPTRMALAMCGGVIPGWLQRVNFMMMNPMKSFVTDYIDIAKAVADGDDAKLHSDKKFRDWFFDIQDMAKWPLEATEDLFIGNKMVKDLMVIEDQKIELKNITIPLALIGGTKDNITPPEQVMALEEYVGSFIVKKYLVNKGHGLFVSATTQPTFQQSAIDMDAAITA